jgi:hypothetical protein
MDMPDKNPGARSQNSGERGTNFFLLTSGF